MARLLIATLLVAAIAGLLALAVADLSSRAGGPAAGDRFSALRKLAFALLATLVLYVATQGGG